jgi:hypothetical protein
LTARKYEGSPRERQNAAARAYYHSEKGHIKARQTAIQYYRKNKDKINERTRTKRLRDWGVKTKGKFDFKWQVAQNRVAPIILRQNGFDNVLQLTGYNCGFPFDWLAKKDGVIYAIEVSCGINHRVKDSQRLLANFADWRYILLFISSDFNKYRLMDYESIPKVRSLSIYSKHANAIVPFDLGEGMQV